jgi:hypothetical protein
VGSPTFFHILAPPLTANYCTTTTPSTSTNRSDALTDPEPPLRQRAPPNSEMEGKYSCTAALVSLWPGAESVPGATDPGDGQGGKEGRADTWPKAASGRGRSLRQKGRIEWVNGARLRCTWLFFPGIYPRWKIWCALFAPVAMFLLYDITYCNAPTTGILSAKRDRACPTTFWCGLVGGWSAPIDALLLVGRPLSGITVQTGGDQGVCLLSMRRSLSGMNGRSLCWRRIRDVGKRDDCAADGSGYYARDARSPVVPPVQRSFSG